MEHHEPPSWAFEGGEIGKLDLEEELDYLEIRLQKLESKDFKVRRKSAEALAPYVLENRLLDEVRKRFLVQPPHPAQVLADGILGSHGDKNSNMSSAQALAHMGPAAAPYASLALGELMSHAEDEIRWEAARALGYLGPGAAKDAADRMAKQLDPDDEPSVLVRFATVESLGLMGAEAAKGGAHALAMALTDPDTSVRNAAALSLAMIGPDAAPLAAELVVRAMLEGSFELRRLAVKALAQMGEACWEVAAYPCCRVLNRMEPCCRRRYHAMKKCRRRNAKCQKCLATGPFAKGTDYTCTTCHCPADTPDVAFTHHNHECGCKWDICRECYCKLRHEDVVLQRLACDALFAMGEKAVQKHQIYLARALNDPDEVVVEKAIATLEMGKCEQALHGDAHSTKAHPTKGGPMALYDKTHHPCKSIGCLLCKHHMLEETKALEDEEPTSARDDEGDEDDPLSDFGGDGDEDEAPRKTNVVPEAPTIMEAVASETKPESPKSQHSEEDESLFKLGSDIAEQRREEESLTNLGHEIMEQRRDPWGPAEQVATNRTRPRPSLEVDTGHEKRTTQPMVPQTPEEDP